eukprot:TRINITY_DN109099_c0_g1_i1.p1 TRINITY_DN109099_c0_g1~~TRINITY_DN109099_c0_g1_i1.p1  ORF type:complete len:252 (-),score=46.22 TRINITY_DN109099_c0_g1_i1:237-992(-)
MPVVRRRSQLLRAVVMAIAFACLVNSCSFVAAPVLSLGTRPTRQQETLAGWRGGSNCPPHLRQTFSGGGPGLRGGLSGGGKPEPPWISIALLAAIVLNFFPGPWHIILDPILGLISAFYSFLFTSILLIPLLLFAAVFAFSWYVENQLETICEGTCPACGTQQVGTKNGPFPCQGCGVDLEVKDDEFIKYVKSGKAPSTPLEQMEEFAKQAAKKGEDLSSKASKASSSVEVVDVEPTKKKSKSDVIDVDVL